MRFIFKLAIGIVLVLAAVTPMMECFDHWDRNVVPATDTELRVTAVFVCAGLVLAVAKLLRYVLAVADSKTSSIEISTAPFELRFDKTDGPLPTGSPPCLIPLRI